MPSPLGLILGHLVFIYVELKVVCIITFPEKRNTRVCHVNAAIWSRVLGKECHNSALSALHLKSQLVVFIGSILEMRLHLDLSQDNKWTLEL